MVSQASAFAKEEAKEFGSVRKQGWMDKMEKYPRWSSVTQ
jgi:hypothetical protein